MCPETLIWINAICLIILSIDYNEPGKAYVKNIMSFDDIYNHFKRPLWHFIRGRGINDADAEDVFHEVALGISNYLGHQQPEDLTKLVFRIARNKIADFFRKCPDNVQMVPMDGMDTADEPFSSPVDSGALQRLINCPDLSTVQQETLVLHYLVGYCPREIARIMDTTVMTAKSRIFLARQKIKRHFDMRKVLV